ncbi:MAG TPA: hypothetical protein VFU21_03935 [Kofleriaceae bacterium]|nr:hypothetical protein [Kofleriaceae bacterium]
MRWLVLSLAVAIGCAGRAGARGGGPGGDGDRFARVHRLLDLYDTARFARSAEARAALGRELGVEVGTGPAATDRVIAALLVEVDRVLAGDRLHAGAQAARTLLELDGKPPARRAEVLQRMAEVKAIARGGGPLADGARLRLAAYCWRALDDATRAPWRQRHFALAHCLYALHDSDPDPYFARDPDRRPPPPRWQDLVAASRSLLADGAADKALGAALAAVEKRTDEMPVEPVSEVMVSADAPLYDWAPVADPKTGVDALRERVQGDGRGQVAVLVPPEGTGDLPELARTARAAGASEIQLLVARRQTLRAPPGDYWHGKPAEVTRAAVVPISLAPLGGTAVSGARSPYAVDFASGLRLTLVIGPSRWRLVGEEGELAVIPSQGKPDPAGLLIEALAVVRAAFPDQQALAVYAEPAARNRDVIGAAAAAARRGGAPFFRLGVAVGPPRVRSGTLARRVKLRAGASVAVVPDTLAARKPALLACYQDALEKAPALAGAVRLEPRSGAAAVVGKADRRLAACATGALGKAVVDSGATSAEVTFRVSGSR